MLLREPAAPQSRVCEASALLCWPIGHVLRHSGDAAAAQAMRSNVLRLFELSLPHLLLTVSAGGGQHAQRSSLVDQRLAHHLGAIREDRLQVIHADIVIEGPLSACDAA